MSSLYVPLYMVYENKEDSLIIKWEFEYTLFAFQDKLVDRLLFIKDKIFSKH